MSDKTRDTVPYFRADLLEQIANEMCLKEGEEAVRRVLGVVLKKGKIGTKNLAREVRLPVPVTAAIRRELEKRGLITRKGGATLTKVGEKYVTQVLGMIKDQGFNQVKREMKLNFEHNELLEKLKEYMVQRPPVNFSLDQSHATPETSLKRVLYMMNEGDLAGRKVIFLGDDDYTSVAAGFLGVTKEITVVDVDERLIKAISEISQEEELKINCILHDLRDPLPQRLLKKFDVFFTDPPYTIPGLSLFLSRGIEALRKRKTATSYLAFADKPPKEMLAVHKTILEAGLYIEELIPRFNLYEGAEILANTTFLAKLMVTEDARSVVPETYGGDIYTGQLRPTVRIYKCKCGKRISVGASESFVTIENLKERGCPQCGNKRGFRLIKREKLK